MIIDKRLNMRVDPTIFPDGTSQVWMLDSLDIEDLYWYFEDEREVFWLQQLFMLCPEIPYLVMPYLPYGRQDKEVDNHKTFAREAFFAILEQWHWPGLFYTFDMHGADPGESFLKGLVNVDPTPIIGAVYRELQPDLIVFPDSGAYERAKIKSYVNTVTLQKHRDPLTGHIGHMRCPEDLTGKRVLIVDDICDGGATFLRAASACYECHADEVSLYVSHGLFTKGISPLHQAGIANIYSTDSTLGRYTGVTYLSIGEAINTAIHNCACVYNNPITERVESLAE